MPGIDKLSVGNTPSKASSSSFVLVDGHSLDRSSNPSYIASTGSPSGALTRADRKELSASAESTPLTASTTPLSASTTSYFRAHKALRLDAAQETSSEEGEGSQETLETRLGRYCGTLPVDLPYYEISGTPMAAAQLAAVYAEHGVRVDVGDLVDRPTMMAQAVYVGRFLTK